MRYAFLDSAPPVASSSRRAEGARSYVDQAGAIVMRMIAPAKINLTLEVLAKRDDGYHGVRSVMVPLAFGDTVEIEEAPQTIFTCSDSSLSGSDNLVVKALSAIGARASVHLEKHVPVQAGLGGGSSDAASVLLAAASGIIGYSGNTDMLATAHCLGSDVPFFLCGTAALVEGTGERVTALGAIPAWHVILIKPPVAVSTAHAYKQLDERTRPTRPRSSSVSLDMVEALQRGEFQRVQTLLQNDFHEDAVSAYPEVAQAATALRTASGRRALLSGSGSSVFSLFEDEASASEAQQRLQLDSTFRVISTRFAAPDAWRAEAR